VKLGLDRIAAGTCLDPAAAIEVARAAESAGSDLA
jgi:hypothetical protein